MRNCDTANIYGIIYKLMCSVSQQIYEQMITRMTKKRVTFLIMAMAATSVRRCVCGCRFRARSDLNSCTETVLSQNPGMLFYYDYSGKGFSRYWIGQLETDRKGGKREGTKYTAYVYYQVSYWDTTITGCF